MIRDRVKFNELIGKTFIKIEGDVQDNKLKFYTNDGYVYSMYHHQECCENVYIEDISGDLQSFVGKKIRSAEEVYKDDPEARESGTWTFYRLMTEDWKDDLVVIRWYGSSNGYYSESASIYKEKVCHLPLTT